MSSKLGGRTLEGLPCAHGRNVEEHEEHLVLQQSSIPVPEPVTLHLGRRIQGGCKLIARTILAADQISTEQISTEQIRILLCCNIFV